MIKKWNKFNEDKGYNFDDPEFETEKWHTITLGDTLTVPKNLTTDPFDKKGLTGKVVKMEGDIVYLKFNDNDIAPFDINVFK